MNVGGFHHVGILVADFDAVRRVLAGCLGFEARESEPDPQLGIEILWVDAGGVALEFIRPTDPDGRAAALLRDGRGGIHHVAFAVDDVDRALREVRDAGVATLDDVPRRGAHGSRIAFLDPAALEGALVELVQPGANNT